MIKGINHVTLSVADLERSFTFYTSILMCRPVARWARGADLLAGDSWLCLSLDPETRDGPYAEYTHIAFSVDANAYAAFLDTVKTARLPVWKTNKSEGQSLYILDPDGHKLEMHVGDLESRLAALKELPYEGLQLFDHPAINNR